MTVRRIYHYRLTCDARRSPDCLPAADALGTDEIDAALAAGWGHRGVAGEVTDAWCPMCGEVRQ